MLKFSVLFALAVTFTVTNGHSAYNSGSSNYQKRFNILEAIAKNKYHVFNYTVETEDGYLLDLIRIPPSRPYRNQGASSLSCSSESAQVDSGSQNANNCNSQESSESQSNEQPGILPPIVLLMPGLLSSADDFVLAGPKEGLAYVMADADYDVYLGNVRGSLYGRKHTVLNPERDAAFWQFSLDDIGRKDLPAIIDKVQEIAGHRKIYYVGHMQGSTVFYIMASRKPAYNEKIYAMVALGPVAFMGRSTNTLYRLVSRNMQSPGWVAKYLGLNEFRPSQELISEGGKADCLSKKHDVMMCENVFFLLNGYDSNHLNSSTIEYVKRRTPSGSSSRQLMHYGEMVTTGRFANYIMNEGLGEDYPLRFITVPMIMYYTLHDTVSQILDVNKLSSLLPTFKEKIMVEEYTNNLDFLFGNHIAQVVYRPMIEKMRQITNDSNNYQNNNPNYYQNNNPNNYQNNNPNYQNNNPNYQNNNPNYKNNNPNYHNNNPNYQKNNPNYQSNYPNYQHNNPNNNPNYQNNNPNYQNNNPNYKSNNPNYHNNNPNYQKNNPNYQSNYPNYQHNNPNNYQNNNPNYQNNNHNYQNNPNNGPSSREY